MSAMTRLQGNSLAARATRSALLTVGGFGFAQALRLASNLILTRLLFPEAFGLMALVLVWLMGLGLFSDVGITPAILHSKRGDDRDFLNTAWTMQIIRGVGLWVTACLLAFPMAWVYDEPMLTQILPVAALLLLFNGFRPTRMITANRHLNLGRLTLLEAAVQVVGVSSGVILAVLTGSIWSLVAAGVIGAAAELVIYGLFLPGERNRLRWEPKAVKELFSFGKWMFLSTACGFFFLQADKLLIGKFIPLDAFGVYNIGFFLAAFPMMLGTMVTQKVLIPIYREAPPRESRANFLKLRKMRFLASAALIPMVGIFALLGVWIVGVLYDPRYVNAGAVVVVLACAQIPAILVLTYDQAALAAGDSKRFFVLSAVRAVVMVACLLVGLQSGGLLGALVGQGVAYLVIYPGVVWLARHMGAWDPLHDAVFALIGLVLTALALGGNWPHFMALAVKTGG
ncbi:MAG: oligosaccharide flippase family protein [Pelagimonas sp.]